MRWKRRNTTEYKSIGIICSKAIRSPGVPPGRTLNKLLEDHKETFKGWFIFSTWGTYFDAILDETERQKLLHELSKKYKLEVYKNSLDETERQKLLHELSEKYQLELYKKYLKAYKKSSSLWKSKLSWLEHGYPLRPGKLGGIIEMAKHLEKSAGPDRIEHLIFITDPDALEESYPEDRALIRAAIRNNVLYLPTYRTAALWAAYEAPKNLNGEHAKTSRTNPDPKNSKGKEHAKTSRTNPEVEALALIAHDGKKLDLCCWVVKHSHRIKRFRRIMTTGATGEWISKFLLASGIGKHKIDLIDKMASGPKGGDVEISGEVLRGSCHHVVFFVDPMTSHPHEADIQALLRTCSMPDVDVNLRLTERAAESWIETV